MFELRGNKAIDRSIESSIMSLAVTNTPSEPDENLAVVRRSARLKSFSPDEYGEL